MRNSVVRMSVVSVLLLVGSLTVPSSASAGLIGVWSFDGDATDSVGSNNGNVMGGATFVAGHAGFGQALSFDGTDDYVDLGFVGFPTYASSITIEAWFRTSAITEQYILQYGELDPPGPNGALVSLGTGKLGSSPVSQLITTPRGTLIQAGTNIADGQWHHGAMTFDQPTSRLRLYVDGTLEAGPSTAGLAAVIATNFAGRHSKQLLFLDRRDRRTAYLQPRSDRE